jgi:type IV pilus assembly protein PilX
VSKRNFQDHRRESGAALIVSLLLLLVLTILGVVMMQTSRMQERMAGNTRDLNMGLQGAESGLRYGEAILQAYAAKPDESSTIPCTVCWNNVLPIAIYDPAQFDWMANAQTYGAGTVPAALSGSTQQLNQEPRYTTEHLAFVKDNEDPTDPSGRDFYQITSRSTGATGLTNVVLQSTYARRF